MKGQRGWRGHSSLWFSAEHSFLQLLSVSGLPCRLPQCLVPVPEHTRHQSSSGLAQMPHIYRAFPALGSGHPHAVWEEVLSPVQEFGSPRDEMSPGLEPPLTAAPYLWEQTPYLNTAIPRLLQSAACPVQRGSPGWTPAASSFPTPGPAAP